MGEFFRSGGIGMYPILVFGFLLVVTSVLFLMRPERRVAPLLTTLGITTASAGFLNFCVGLMLTFRYVERVPREEQFEIAALGVGESLHNILLAFALIVIAAVLASIGSFRLARARTVGDVG